MPWAMKSEAKSYGHLQVFKRNPRPKTKAKVAYISLEITHTGKRVA